MTHYSLSDLGWSENRHAELDAGDTAHLFRVTSVARDRLFVLGPDGPQTLVPPSNRSTGSYAVGDWVLADASCERVDKCLARTSVLSRRAAGTDARTQLIAANVDTLGIVTSCNADFNLSRLERYLALAWSAGCLPLVILTKSDLCEDTQSYIRQAERLSPLVTAIALGRH